MSFHSFERGDDSKNSIIEKMWFLHNKYPLPHNLNIAARYIVYLLRKIHRKIIAKRKMYNGKAIEEKDVKNDEIEVASTTATMSDDSTLSEAEKRFKHVHGINSELRTEEGAWVPQPHAIYAGSGISVEEVALRVVGYISAYEATSNQEFLDTAREGVDYLVSKRIYKDGHIHLQGHTVVDITYAFVGRALLSLYEHDENEDILTIAKKIGDKLVKYHISGSVNHAITPVQLLCPLYKKTGEKKYRKNIVKRVFRSAVPLQLPYGGWLGHESWIWYHALIMRGLILSYTALPYDIKYRSKKDKIARCIVASVNRLIKYQRPDGSFRIRPDVPICQSTNDDKYYSDRCTYNGEKFVKVDNEKCKGYGMWNGYIIDTLVTAYNHLGIDEVVPVIIRFGSLLSKTSIVSRLEFDTLGSGRYLNFVNKHKSNPKPNAVS